MYGRYPQAMTTTAWSIDRPASAARIPSVQQRVAAGLAATPKRLDPVLFYDARGSELFERICEVEDYYVTRTERAIIEENAESIAERTAPTVTVAELGSGSSEKTAVLLERLLDSGREVRYVPIDVSESALIEAADRLSKEMPALEICAVAAEYEPALARLPTLVDGQCLLLFLGSNLGNFDPAGAARLLRSMRAALPEASDRLLLGLDLVKDRSTLERAYDDRQGVTAQFNKNVLSRINRELDAEFDLDAFQHLAHWNDEKRRVEMHLLSKVDQEVHIAALGRSVKMAAGETIHTESSYKFTPEGVDRLAVETGFALETRFVDENRLFSLNLLSPRSDA